MLRYWNISILGKTVWAQAGFPSIWRESLDTRWFPGHGGADAGQSAHGAGGPYDWLSELPAASAQVSRVCLFQLLFDFLYLISVHLDKNINKNLYKTSKSNPM